MVPFLAFSLQDQVEKYGAYIGIAAFFGLAVLTILYFAQARELRRLRDWAGRAPERAQEIEARAIAQAEAARRVQPQPRHAPATPAPAPAPATAGGATAAAASAAAPEQAGQSTQVIDPPADAGHAGNGTAAAASEADAEAPEEQAGAGDAATGGEPPSGEPGAAAGTEPPPAAAEAPAAQGEVAPAGQEEQPAEAGEAKPEQDAQPEPVGPAAVAAGAAARDDEPDEEPGDEPAEIPVAPVPRATPLPRRSPAPAAPLRQPNRSATVPPRRPAPDSGRRSPLVPAGEARGPSRLVPLLVGAGVLALAVAALFVTGVIGGGDGDPSTEPTTAGTPTPGASTPAELTPASTKVAVLNGTTTAGLASREKDALTGAGFTQIATGNNTDQQRADSSVLFGTRAGARAQARSVAEQLNIGTVQRMDADTRDLSEDADVVVILGQDKAP